MRSLRLMLSSAFEHLRFTPSFAGHRVNLSWLYGDREVGIRESEAHRERRVARVDVGEIGWLRAEVVVCAPHHPHTAPIVYTAPSPSPFYLLPQDRLAQHLPVLVPQALAPVDRQVRVEVGHLLDLLHEKLVARLEPLRARITQQLQHGVALRHPVREEWEQPVGQSLSPREGGSIATWI